MCASGARWAGSRRGRRGSAISASRWTELSFRSKGDIDVNRLANQYNGGGHKNASGGRLADTSDLAITRLIADAEPYILQEETV